MINFIICDDNKQFLKNEKNIIDNFMMKYDIEYNCNLFVDYDKEFEKMLAKETGLKVYVLDIQTKTSSGLDIARKIREEQDDWVSIIIIVTAFNEFKYEALSNRLFLFDFINKLSGFESKFKEDIERVIKHYDKRNKCIKYKYNQVLKNIELRHIVYIEKELDSKRCIIKTVYGSYVINKNLNDTLRLLDERFLKTSRSMIVNLDYISEYNIKDNKIVFKNGDYTFQISRGVKKGLKKYVS